MVNDICDHFKLDYLDRSSLTLESVLVDWDKNEDKKEEKNGNDENNLMQVECSDDLSALWDDIIVNAKEKYVEIVVSGISGISGIADAAVKDSGIAAGVTAEMIGEWNDCLLNFDFDKKNNAEEEMNFLLNQVMFRKRNLSWMNESENEKIRQPLLIICDRLLDSLKLEGHTEASTIVASIRKCKKEIEMSMNWTNIYGFVNAAMKKLRPFNIDEMLSLYEKTLDATTQVNNQDIALLIGHTGAGKSTTIHFLAGSTMQIDNCTRHIYPSEIAHPALKQVKTEFSVAQSVTRYIAAVPISLSKMGVKTFGLNAKDSILLCDTPGFDDSSGAEVDVANGLGVIKAVECAKSTKIVLIVGKADLDLRMASFKKLCYTLSSILKNFMVHLRCVNVIFTKIGGNNPVNYIRRTFEQALDDMKERKEDNDDVVVKTCSHIIKLCKSNSIVVLNPLTDDRSIVLETLFADDTTWIDSPKDEFESFVTPSSKASIIAQIVKSKDSIVSAPTNYDLVYQKLVQIDKVNNILAEKDIRDRIDDCVITVRKCWNERCDNAKNELSACVKMGSLQSLHNETRKYKETLEDLNEYDKLYEQFLKVDKEKELEAENGYEEKEERCESPQSMKLLVLQMFDLLLSNLEIWETRKEEEMKEEEKKGDKLEQDTIENSLEKVNIMIQVFDDYPEIVEKYNMKMGQLGTTAQKNSEAAKSYIDKNEFEKCFEILAHFGSSYEAHSRIGDPCQIAARLKSVMQHLMRHVKQYHFQLIGMIGSSNGYFDSSKKDLANGKMMYQALENACIWGNKMKGELGLELNEMVNECNRIYDKTLAEIVAHCASVAAHINSILWTNDSVSRVSGDSSQASQALSEALSEEKQKMKELEVYLNYLTKIRGIHKDIERDTSESYYQSIQQTISFLQRIERQFESIMESLNVNNENVNYNDLVKCVNILSESKWVHKFDGSEEEENEILKNVGARLENHIIKIESVAHGSRISVDNVKDLKGICTVMNHVSQMGRLSELFPKVIQKSDEIANVIKESILSELARVSKKFDAKSDELSGNLDRKMAQNALLFIAKCKTVQWGQTNLALMQKKICEAHDNLRDCLIEYGRNENRKMEKWLKHLMHGETKGNENKELSSDDMAYGLASCLYEFDQINDRYKMVMDYICQGANSDNLLDTWQKKLIQSHKELEQRFAQLRNGNSIALPAQVSRARLLSKIDWFLPKAKFNTLYIEYEKNLHNDAGYNKILECISKDSPDFAEIGKELSKLSQMCKLPNASNKAVLKSLFEHSQTVVSRKIADIFHDAKSKVIRLRNKMDDDALLNDIRFSQKIRKDSKSYCLRLLTKEQQSEITKLEKETSDLLDQCMKQVELLTSTFIEAQQFVKAEGRIESMATIALLLERQDVSQEFEKKIETKLKKLEMYYVGNKEEAKSDEGITLANCKVNPYAACPPSKLYCELEELLSKRSIYQATWTAIESDIIEKFHNELDKARKSDCGQRQRILRVCQSVLSSLPEKLKSSLGEALSYCKDDILEQEKEERQFIDELTKSNDMKQLAQCYYQRVNARDAANARRLRTIMMEQARRCSNDISVASQEMNGLNIAKGIVPLRDMVNALSERSKIDVRGSGDRLQFQVAESYQHCCETVSARCCGIIETGIKGYKINSEKKLMSEFEIKATFLINLSKILLPESDIFEKLKLKDVLISVIDEINDNGRNIDAKFSKALRDGNLKLLNETLNIIESYQVKSHLYLQDLNLLSMKFDNKELVISSWDYGGIANQIAEMLAVYGNEILARDLINDETSKSEASRIKYFVTILKPRFETLAHYCNDKNLQARREIIGNATEIYQNCQDTYVKQVRNLYNEMNQLLASDLFFQVKQLVKLNLYCCCLDQFSKNVANTFDKRNCDTIKNCIHDFSMKLENKFDMMVKDVRDKVTASGKQNSDLMDRIEAKIIINNNNNKKNNNGTGDMTRNEKNADILADCLIKLSKCSNLLTFMCDTLTRMIDDILTEYAQNNAMQVGSLSVLLEKKDTVWGSQLVAQHEIFRGQLIYRFNTNAHSQSIDDVLSGIKTDSSNHYAKKAFSNVVYGVGCAFDPKSLKANYDKCFVTYYTPLIEQYLKEPVNSDALIHTLKTTIASQGSLKLRPYLKIDKESGVCTFNNNRYWTDGIKNVIIHMMAYVFAIWTLDNSKYYFEASKELSESERRKFLLEPKAAQIAALIRLLNIDDGSKLCSNFVEIGTGEGKSLTLAVAACVLALLGFEVNCVCYSKYLSKRDFESFQTLFERLGIAKSIEYSTLHDLCNKLITKDINIRDETTNMLLNNAKWNNKNDNNNLYETKENKENKDNKPSVLLFDEVDVLFGDSFFGRSYNPLALVNNGKISALTDFIWQTYKNNKSKLNVEHIKASTEYSNVLKLCQNDEKRRSFFVKQINKMIKDVKNHDQVHYIVRDDEICYKQLDSYVSTLSHGYKTMFAYYFEHDLGKIQDINTRKQLRAVCGNFSYVESINKFNVILGVTGTLKDVISNEIQKQAIEKIFKIEKYTFMPTLYTKDNKRETSDNFPMTLCCEKYFHETLKDEICTNLLGQKDNARCVFVFFQDIEQLNAFDNCDEFAFCKGNRILLTEELTNDEKKSAVTRACISESILLATKSFGRGTDFQVKDKIVALNGGPHVIQTFFSVDKSEETQIKGRTARQGGQGSFSMVLNQEKTMKDFGVSTEEINKCPDDSSLYKLLDGKRREKFEKSFGRLVEMAGEPNEYHECSIKLKNALIRKDAVVAMECIEKLN